MDVLVLFKDRMVTNCLIQFPGFSITQADRCGKENLHAPFAHFVRVAGHFVIIRLIFPAGRFILSLYASDRNKGCVNPEIVFPF